MSAGDAAVGVAADSGGRVDSGDGVSVGMVVGISVSTVVIVGEGVADGNSVGVSTIVSSTIGVEVKVLKLATFTVDVGVGFDPTETSLKPHANNRTNMQRKMRYRFIVHHDKLTWLIPQIGNLFRPPGVLYPEPETSYWRILS